jgi:hypothetical protein
MDPAQPRESRVLWSFWLACGLAATGAIAQLLLTAGGSSPISGGAIPFGFAALAMAANALAYPAGKSFATSLYVLAWLAIVYGVLRMVAIPLQQVVVGTCPVSEGCSAGFAAPFSGGEGLGIGVGIVTGALALQAGLFGLRILYRGPRKRSPAARETATALPPPVVDPAVARPPETAPSSPDTAAAPPVEVAAASKAPTPVRKPRTKRPPKPAAELPPPTEPAELPPHVEPAELPPHPGPPERDSSTTSSS